MMRQTIKALGGAAIALMLATPQAAVQGNPLYEQVMYGIDRQSSMLYRYDFAAGQQKAVGLVRDRSGVTYGGGIDASAYAIGTDTMPAYTNLFAFRWDADSYRAQMLWVDVRTAEADMGNANLEGGPIGGATAVFRDGQWQVYAVQHELLSPPFKIKGTIANINPNNSDMSFQLVAADGQIISRDDLKSAKRSDLDANNNLFVGEAVEVRIRPKGQGNNNTLTVTYPGQEPEVFQLRNSNTYVFSGSMQVRLHNPQTSGNSMGHWFLEVDGSAWINGAVEVLSPHRLVHVAHYEDAAQEITLGTVTELVSLSRPYDSLASRDGVVFYAGYKNELWRIDLSGGAVLEAQINNKVANPVHARLLGMDFIGDSLFAYELHDGALHMLNLQTGNREMTVSGLNSAKLGTIFFCPVANDRHNDPIAFD